MAINIHTDQFAFPLELYPKTNSNYDASKINFVTPVTDAQGNKYWKSEKEIAIFKLSGFIKFIEACRLGT